MLERSNALNNIPDKKLQEYILNIKNKNLSLENETIVLQAINKYFESNIPVEYWSLKMERDFTGDPRLLEQYKIYTADIKSSYVNGTSICFAGTHGVGKTFLTTSILKKVVEKGFTALYSTLSDIVNVMTNAPNEERYIAKRELCMTDFLVIDEFDNRFIGNSQNAEDLYARSLESVFRTRSQNKLPTLMCTNSPNVVESFNGSLKASIDSLMKGYLKVFPIFGEDFRKKK